MPLLSWQVLPCVIDVGTNNERLLNVGVLPGYPALSLSVQHLISIAVVSMVEAAC